MSNSNADKPSLPLPWMKACSSPTLLLTPAQGPPQQWLATAKSLKNKSGNSILAVSGSVADTANVVR